MDSRFLIAIGLLIATPAIADDQALIQNQLSNRIGEEMNKAISCEVVKSHSDAALSDADATQDELQDAAD